MARYKKIIVTGANGYIGNNLLHRLKKERINAIGISRSGPDIKLDLLDSKKTINILNQYKDYTLFHCAAYVPKKKKDYNNIINNKKNIFMIENIIKSKIKSIFFLSTFSVYNNKKLAKANKLKVSSKNNNYANSKICSENKLLSSNKKIKIIRIPGIFGGRRKDGLIYKAIYSLEYKKNFKVFKRYPNWVGMHIDDLISILIQIIKRKEFGRNIINVSYFINYSVSETLKIIFEKYGQKEKINQHKTYRVHNNFKYKNITNFRTRIFQIIKEIKNDKKNI